MPSIMRHTVVVTGVAGSPYYISGYALAGVGTAATFAAAWRAFVINAPASLPAGSVWTGEPFVSVIDTTTGDLTGQLPVPSQTTLGTSGADILPGFTQRVINWRTNVFQNGRQVQGRTNIPCPFEGASGVSGQPSAAEISAWSARAQTYIDNPDVDPIVWSRTTGAAPTITAASMSSSWGVLRSRR